MLWGGENLVNTKLVGPGRVFIQSLPLQTFANNMVALMGVGAGNNSSNNGELDAGDVINVVSKLL